jgi:hypothetical protein
MINLLIADRAETLSGMLLAMTELTNLVHLRRLLGPVLCTVTVARPVCHSLLLQRWRWERE